MTTLPKTQPTTRSVSVNLPASIPIAPLILAAAWLVILPIAVHDDNSALDAFVVALAVLVAGSFVTATRRAHATVATVLATFLLVRVLPTAYAYALPIIGATVAMFFYVSPDGLGLKHATRKTRAAISGLTVSGLVLFGVYRFHPLGDGRAGFLPFSWSILAALAACVACAFFTLNLARSLIELALAYVPVAIGVLIVVAILVHALRTVPPTLGFGIVLLLSLTAYAVLGWLAARRGRRNATREKTRNADDFARAAFRKLGWTEASLTSKAVVPLWTVAMWPYGLEDEIGATIRLRHSPGWDGDEAALADLAAKLHGGTWATERDYTKDHVVLTRQAAPFTLPTMLPYAEMVALAPERQQFAPLGVNADGQCFGWNYDANTGSPHGLLFGPTGAGKSIAAAVIIASFAKQGALIDIIDAKAERQSDYEAIRLPCVRVHKGGEASITAFAAFTAEMDRRRGLTLADQKRQPHWLMIIDEAWEYLGAARLAYKRDHPKAPLKDDPTLVNLARVVRLSRSLRMNLLIGTQMPDVNDLGGGDVRRMLGFTLAFGELSDADALKVFRSTAPDDHQFHVKGRALTQIPGKLLSVQVAYLEPRDVLAAVAPSPVASFPQTADEDDETMAEFEADIAAQEHEQPCPVVPMRLIKAVPEPADETVEPRVADVVIEPPDVVIEPEKTTIQPSRARIEPKNDGSDNDNMTTSGRSKSTFPCPKCAGEVATRVAPGGNGARCPCGWRGRVPKSAEVTR